MLLIKIVNNSFSLFFNLNFLKLLYILVKLYLLLKFLIIKKSNTSNIIPRRNTHCDWINNLV